MLTNKYHWQLLVMNILDFHKILDNGAILYIDNVSDFNDNWRGTWCSLWSSWDGDNIHNHDHVTYLWCKLNSSIGWQYFLFYCVPYTSRDASATFSLPNAHVSHFNFISETHFFTFRLFFRIKNSQIHLFLIWIGFRAYRLMGHWWLPVSNPAIHLPRHQHIQRHDAAHSPKMQCRK